MMADLASSDQSSVAADNINPPLLNRLFKRFNSSLMSVWFRKIEVIDNQNIPPKGGIIYVSWHPSGMIDPLILHSSLPGKVTVATSHNLLKVPVLGRILKSGGLVPINYSDDSLGSEGDSSEMLSSLANLVANGGKVVIFPQGRSYGGSEISNIRSDVSKVLLEAMNYSTKHNLPMPKIISVGLHYSNSQKFRERCAIILERPMEFDEIPDTNLATSKEIEDWLLSTNRSIESELNRASQSRASWEERELIWLARSIVYAERKKISGDKPAKPTFSESILGARRIRAGWEYYAENNPAKIESLVQQSKDHFRELSSLNLRPIDVSTKPEKPGLGGQIKALFLWAWSAAWMFGLVTWSALIGNGAPYQANYLAMSYLNKRNLDESIQATMKISIGLVLFPIWWTFLSISIAVILLSSSSPVYILFNKHWLLAKLTMINPLLVFLVLMIWWPISGKLHMNLYSRLVANWRNLTRWRRWRKSDHDWIRLSERQSNIGMQLIEFGDALVLPGDHEWVAPKTGNDDYTSVKPRQS